MSIGCGRPGYTDQDISWVSLSTAITLPTSVYSVCAVGQAARPGQRGSVMVCAATVVRHLAARPRHLASTAVAGRRAGTA